MQCWLEPKQIQIADQGCIQIEKNGKPQIRETIQHLAYLLTRLRNSASFGTAFALMNVSMGGVFPLERIFRMARVAKITSFSLPPLIPDI